MSNRIISTPQEFAELKVECARQVKYYVDLANRKLDLHMGYPVVDFGLKGTTAGMAYYHGQYRPGKIKFQPTLLFENADHFIEQTVGHEVGHLVAHFRHPTKTIAPHGMEWRSVMWTLGLPATRCHNYDTSHVETRSISVRRVMKPNTDRANISPHGRLIEWD